LFPGTPVKGDKRGRVTEPRCIHNYDLSAPCRNALS
jgi:hypothetical protein